ncbi:putative transposase [Streptomyces griseofuscus]|uniref:Putative transposase n=1 Tax=Streptomyces griseofuscus TaxID=146922 RepID=A0A7H1PR88_9ACTN|nr:putative transposase [Streptomyces griseofuscus]
MLVTPVSVTDRDGARELLPQTAGRFRRLARVWADGRHTGHLTDWTGRHLGIFLDIVRRSEVVRGFQPLPRRWVAWVLRGRRLVRDHERRTDTSEAVIRWSMIALMNHPPAAQPHPCAVLPAA